MRGLDFRFFLGDKKIGAPFHGLKAFFTTPQLNLLDKVRLEPVLCFRWRGMQQSAHQGLQSPAACISASWHCKRFSMRSVCALQAVHSMKGSAMVLWLSEDSAIPSSPAGDTSPLSNIAGFNHKKPLAPCTSFVVWAACTMAGGVTVFVTVLN